MSATNAVIAELMDRRLLNDVDGDLHQEIAEAVIKAAQPAADDDEPLSTRDLAMIDQAWENHKAALPVATVVNDNQPDRTAIIEITIDPPTLPVGTKLYAGPKMVELAAETPGDVVAMKEACKRAALAHKVEGPTNNAYDRGKNATCEIIAAAIDRLDVKAEAGHGDDYSKEIERKMMDVADMIAATLDQPSDPRAWDHLLVYAPRDALERRLSTLNPGEYDDTVLAPNRTDDEVRQRNVDRGGFEPGNSDQVENEPSRNAPLRMEVSNCGAQGVITAIDRLDVKAEAKSQEPEAVKPLEWDKHPDDDEWYSIDEGNYQISDYLVYRSPSSETSWCLKVRGYLLDEDFSSPDEAKAAAQADYEQRIRSALIHPTTKPEAPAVSVDAIQLARSIEGAWDVEPVPFNRADVAARVAIAALIDGER